MSRPLFYLDTEIELAGETRLCSVSYILTDDGEIDIHNVVAGRRFQAWYTGLGEYEPRDERIDVDVTQLLSAKQIEGFELKIIETMEAA
ncbi:hypothetical protein [Candidatus Contendibacter odensensis]|uniref:Uncharacterized protein n=1 Tax=Candidatus Contendobacter odensis Run_B_J11 TaxID=1400861 RepID=A0A7U7J490_9GAMM|nr:hypothetical protein [Candidatus Contendobacter odensis]CDH46986.1 hypothetical protein BN874_690036 [Candidatus Contendobacter odensis Run_B_J11]